MTENVQPGTGGAASGERPTSLTEYTKQRQHLKELLGKRKQQERQLSQLEQSIIDLETKYLNNTRYGNIVKGFDNYIKGTSSAAQRKQGELKDEDFIWSRSSISYNNLHPDNTEATSATSTPGAPTPVSTTFANREKDSASSHPTPTSATERGSGKAGKTGKKRTQKKDKDADAEDSETDSRETKKVRTHFGASRK